MIIIYCRSIVLLYSIWDSCSSIHCNHYRRQEQTSLAEMKNHAVGWISIISIPKCSGPWSRAFQWGMLGFGTG